MTPEEEEEEEEEGERRFQVIFVNGCTTPSSSPFSSSSPSAKIERIRSDSQKIRREKNRDNKFCYLKKKKKKKKKKRKNVGGIARGRCV